MSLSASLPVNSAAAPLGAAAGASSNAAGMMPDGGISVFDILLQQIAAETPVHAAAVTQPAGDVAAVLIAEEAETEAAETDKPETEAPEIEALKEGDAALPAQIAPVVTAPVVQPQINSAEAAPELSQDMSLAIDAKASKGKSEKSSNVPATGGRTADDAKEGEAADTIDTDLIGSLAKDAAETVRAVIKADPKEVVSKLRDAVTGTDPQPAQPAADPRTVSAAAADAPTSSAFSMQAIADTQGSYTATGASTAAGSNMSRAAVETLSALSMQISKKLEQGSTKFAIELYPADLGKVEVSLHIGRDGKTTAHLTFDSPVTAASFSASEPELRQQLANAGLSVDKDALSFSSRDSGNGFGSAMAQDQNKDQQQQHSQARHASRALEAARKVADDSDLEAALNTAMNAMRTGASKLALNLIV